MTKLNAFLIALFAPLAFGPTTATAASPTLEESLESAWADVEQLEDLLDDKGATNRAINQYLQVVTGTATELKLSTSAEADVDSAVLDRKLSRSLEKLRKETVDLLLEAVNETDLDGAGNNEREAVNLQAVKLLAAVPAFIREEDDRARLSRRIIRKVRRLERARHDLHPMIFEGCFVALAHLGTPSSLRWIKDEYMRARKQPDEVAKLRGALRAMRQFKRIPGRLRHEILDEMIKRYLAMEALAQQTSAAVQALAAKRFWDAVCTDAIPLAQYVAGYPSGDEGAALATLGDLATWFRDHDDLRDPAWKDAPDTAS